MHFWVTSYMIFLSTDLWEEIFKWSSMHTQQQNTYVVKSYTSKPRTDLAQKKNSSPVMIMTAELLVTPGEVLSII